MDIEWIGDVKGWLTAAHGNVVVKTVDQVIRLADSRSDDMSKSQINALGSCAFFIALRDSEFSSDAMAAARRALDSYDPQLAKAEAHQAFQEGILEIQSRLFQDRSRQSHELVDTAYDYMRQAIRRSNVHAVGY